METNMGASSVGVKSTRSTTTTTTASSTARSETATTTPLVTIGIRTTAATQQRVVSPIVWATSGGAGNTAAMDKTDSGGTLLAKEKSDVGASRGKRGEGGGREKDIFETPLPPLFRTFLVAQRRLLGELLQKGARIGAEPRGGQKVVRIRPPNKKCNGIG